MQRVAPSASEASDHFKLAVSGGGGRIHHNIIVFHKQMRVACLHLTPFFASALGNIIRIGDPSPCRGIRLYSCVLLSLLTSPPAIRGSLVEKQYWMLAVQAKKLAGRAKLFT